MKNQKLVFFALLTILIFSFSIANAAKEEDDIQKVNNSTVQQDNGTNQQSSQRNDIPTRDTGNSGVISRPNIPTDPSKSPNSGEEINWQVIGSGGGTGTSTNYSLSFTIGQTAVGIGSSTTYNLNHGFWQEFMFGSNTCCMGPEVGDANLSGDISVADIAEIVNMKFGTGIPAGPWCLDEADANYSRSVPEATIGDVSVGDIADIVDRKFGSGDLLKQCDGTPNP